MPRVARIKNESGIYHIMIRSISEVLLFKSDDDKIEYMKILSNVQNMYMFKVYGYCLMNNHGHFIIDTYGADISKIMHKINFKYAIYYNKKYKRHGHLFQDRFKSKLVSDLKYLYSLSLYIHSNPLDIEEYKNRIEKYKFSSLNAYLGNCEDKFGVLDFKFILAFFGENIKEARATYRSILMNYSRTEIEEYNFDNEGTLYISGRNIINRNNKLEDLAQFVCRKLNLNESLLYVKYSRKTQKLKAIVVLLMRSLCNASGLEICSFFRNITISRVTSLSSIGLNLVLNDESCKNIMKEFIEINGTM